jgi:hypothetical protein
MKQTQKPFKIELEKEVEELFKKAGASYKRKQQIERDHKFFTWFEENFEIRKYQRGNTNEGNPCLSVGNFIGFICNNFDEMSAEVHTRCSLCETYELHYAGVVKNPEELGKYLSFNGQGNYYFDCGNHSLKRFPN